MGLFKGALAGRRYRVVGEVRGDFRDSYLEALNEHAFREGGEAAEGQERAGWCQVHNLLDVDFTDRGRWLYNHYIAFALRVDKKVLPAKLFKATLEKRLQAWCQENGRERVPRAVREEQKELLTEQMMARTLPRVAVTEACWNVVDGWVFFHTSSEAANDRFRKLFRATFGLGLEPASPLDFLADLPEVAAALEHTGLSDLRPDGEVSDVG